MTCNINSNTDLSKKALMYGKLMKISFIISLILFTAYGFFIIEDGFAQMESMTIDGLKHPYVNSVFNVGVDVDGVSRASGGIFRTVMTLFEKDSGQEILAVPDYLRSGINTIQINMIPDRNIEPMKEGLTYVLQIQHVNIVSQFEFTPKAFESTQEGKTIIVKLQDGVSSGDYLK